MTRSKSDKLFLLSWIGVVIVMFCMGISKFGVLIMLGPVAIVFMAYILSLFHDYF